MSILKILHEDNHLLIIDKPASMPVQPDASGDESLDQAAKKYLRERYGKPGNIYLGLVHRLDRPTSGIVVLAKTDKAAGRMAEVFRKREVVKRYIAVVECFVRPKANAMFRDILISLPNGGMRILEGTATGGSGDGGGGGAAVRGRREEKGRVAELSYHLAGTSADGKRAVLVIDLLTGVKHQIRCQLAARGLPVAGDFRYGAFSRPARPVSVEGGRAILLHAAHIAFMHPVRKEGVSFSSYPPGYWSQFAGGISGWPLSDMQWESLFV